MEPAWFIMLVRVRELQYFFLEIVDKILMTEEAFTLGIGKIFVGNMLKFTTMKQLKIWY